MLYSEHLNTGLFGVWFSHGDHDMKMWHNISDFRSQKIKEKCSEIQTIYPFFQIQSPSENQTVRFSNGHFWTVFGSSFQMDAILFFTIQKPERKFFLTSSLDCFIQKNIFYDL
jgi:hypothetical protein